MLHRNNVLADLLLEKMQVTDGISFTEQERKFARDLQATFPTGSVERSFEWAKNTTTSEVDDNEINNPLWERILPHAPNPPTSSGSTEVGDVSWITPTVELNTCCWSLGTPGHSWQTVVSSGSSIGAKGMLFASKAMALAGLDLMTKPDLLAQAKEEFKRAKKGQDYITPLPEGIRPR